MPPKSKPDTSGLDKLKKDLAAGRPGQLVGFDGAGRAVAVDGAAAPTGAETATQEETNEMLDEVFGFAGE